MMYGMRNAPCTTRKTNKGRYIMFDIPQYKESTPLRDKPLVVVVHADNIKLMKEEIKQRAITKIKRQSYYG